MQQDSMYDNNLPNLSKSLSRSFSPSSWTDVAHMQHTAPDSRARQDLIYQESRGREARGLRLAQGNFAPQKEESQLALNPRITRFFPRELREQAGTTFLIRDLTAQTLLLKKL